MREYDLEDLELQLHGFDAGLAAVEALGPYSSFNRDFTTFVTRSTGLSGSQGWAVAITDRYGAGRAAFNVFCSLLTEALPTQFDVATFDHE